VLGAANGVSHTAKKEHVIVAETTARAVDVYARNMAGALTLKVRARDCVSAIMCVASSTQST
jgi:hypothetical protein